MKPTTTQSEPPARTGGLTLQTTDNAAQDDPGTSTTDTQPPATAGGTDLAALQAENANLKAAIRLRDARDAVTEELKNSGARSPVLLWDVVAGDVEFDERGKPTNIAAILAELKASFPEQFGTQTDGGQIPGTYIPQSIDGGAGQTATPRLTKEALRRMKPAEIAELDWADVRRVLSS
ncbi:MAG: hypothetical protein ABL959_06605 [Pyrinomonadaceae bacterium]